MKKIIILLAVLFVFHSCENNIILKDSNLETTILEFYKNAKYYSGQNIDDKENINTISVTISQDNNKDIIVGFYSFVDLGNHNYIGESRLNKIKILFYSTNPEIAKDLIEVKYKNVFKNNNDKFSETYTEFYKYKNGKLELIKGN